MEGGMEERREGREGRKGWREGEKRGKEGRREGRKVGEKGGREGGEDLSIEGLVVIKLEGLDVTRVRTSSNSSIANSSSAHRTASIAAVAAVEGSIKRFNRHEMTYIGNKYFI